MSRVGIAGNRLKVTAGLKHEIIEFFIKMKNDFDAKAETSFLSFPTNLSREFLALASTITTMAYKSADGDAETMFQKQIDIAGSLEVIGEADSHGESLS